MPTAGQTIHRIKLFAVGVALHRASPAMSPAQFHDARHSDTTPLPSISGSADIRESRAEPEGARGFLEIDPFEQFHANLPLPL